MIAGVDPSTASLGLAGVAGDLSTVKPKAGAKDRDRRLDELEGAVIRRLRLAPPLPRLVIIEGPADHSIGIRATIAVSEVRAVIRLGLWRFGVPSLEVSPTRLKRYATGNGNASKEMMIAAAVIEGAAPANDDEADAYWLRHFGRAGYGLEELTIAHRVEAVSATTWPTIVRLS